MKPYYQDNLITIYHGDARNMAECQGCKKLKRQELLEVSLICKGFEFYEPGEIRFCPHQVIWLIRNIQTLHEFKWPVGYEIEAPKKKSKRAPFITPVDFAVEVERRLEHCRLDGLLVYLYYGYDFEERALAKYYGLSLDELRRRIEAVIWHISGWNFYAEFPYRRWLVYRAYENFKSQRAVKAMSE